MSAVHRRTVGAAGLTAAAPRAPGGILLPGCTACGLLLVSDISNPTHLAPSDSFARQHVARPTLEDAYAAAQQRVHQLQYHPPGLGLCGLWRWRCIEWHISWLLLVGEHVYEFKRPWPWISGLQHRRMRLGRVPGRAAHRPAARPRRMYLDMMGMEGDGSDSRPWRVKPWAAGDATRGEARGADAPL